MCRRLARLLVRSVVGGNGMTIVAARKTRGGGNEMNLHGQDENASCLSSSVVKGPAFDRRPAR